MATITFGADHDDTIIYFNYCEIVYTNIKVKKIELTDEKKEVIVKISDLFNITQFMCLPGPFDDPYIYRIKLLNPDNTPKLIARSYTFEETKINSQKLSDDLKIPLNAKYYSGPNISCPRDITWVLFSILSKKPIILTNGELAAIPLISKPVGSGDNSQLELYFPSNDIIFQSSINNTVFTTRLNGLKWEWEYTLEDNNNKIRTSSFGVSMYDMQLTFELI